MFWYHGRDSSFVVRPTEIPSAGLGICTRICDG